MTETDLILKNANVITMNPEQPTAGLVAISGDKIALVTGNEMLESVRGRTTRVIDCQGKTVVPGFNDAHCHIFSFIRSLLSIDLRPTAVKSITDIKQAIRHKAEDIPPGKWLTGTGYHEFYLAEKRHPTRWDIDEVAPALPVALFHQSLHACVLNSLALSLAGISSETPEPPGGLIERDNNGELTGVMFEMSSYVRERIPSLSEEELVRGVTLANQHYLSQGITSLQEATMANDFNQWQRLQQFQNSGKLKSRVSMMFGNEGMSSLTEAGLSSGDNWLRPGAVKIVLNETTGRLYPPQDELNRQVLNAQQAGFQVAIHAVEPGTVGAAISALEHTYNRLPQTDRRPRIEHCSECPPALLERLKRLQAVVVTQPPFIYYNGDRYLATVPQERIRWLYRIKSLINNGVTVAGSSDSPIVPDNPLMGMYAAVTRQTDSGQLLLSEERITPIQALAMYTTAAAYASFEEHLKGSITPGKLADLVVLSNDPLKSPPEQLKDIRVEMTIINGKVVWNN